MLNSPDEDAKETELAKTPCITMLACCFAALIMPTACIGLALGLLRAEPELDVWNIWAPDSGDYATDKKYLQNLVDTTDMAESGRTSCAFLSHARDGESHLRKAPLSELIERMKAIEAVEVEYNGNTFSYYDACTGGQANKDMYLGYTLPCPVVSAVHSYREGGWEMDIIPQANALWYQELVPLVARPIVASLLLATDFPPIPDFGTLYAPALGLPSTAVCIPAAYCDLAVAANPAAQAACCVYECAATCATAYAQAMNPQALDPTRLAADPDCNACMIQAERALFAALEDPVLAGVLGMGTYVYNSPELNYGDWTFSNIHNEFVDADNLHYKDVWIYNLALYGAFVVLGPSLGIPAGYVMTMPQFETNVLNLLYGVVPYVTNTFTAEATSLGLDKGFRSIEANGTTERELHQWASGDINGWNPLQDYPSELMFGRTVSDDSDILTNVEGLQAVYFLNQPKYFAEKVASSMRAQGPGLRGPVIISEDDAKQILEQMKEKMEEVWTKNWDKSDSATTDVNKYSAFTGGYGGTFYRALKKMTEDSVTPSIVSYLAIIVVSVLLMFSPSLTESKMLVSLCGALFSVVAFCGALGVVVLTGSKLMFTSVWTLPFLLVGLGVDDMYVMLTTLVQEGGDTPSGFFKAMRGCLVPVTMTSFTNAGMFGMLMFVSVPAVREMGKIAMISIGLQYITMVTAFPCICYLDMVRSSSRRLDCFLCCVKGTRSEPVKHLAYSCIYRPILGSVLARIVIVIVSLGLVGVGVYGAMDAEAGGGLKEFFQPGTVEHEFMEMQEEYFDVSWPLAVNFGALEYTNPEVQMHMIDIYEKVIATPYASKVDTDSLWTASLALWGTVDCMDVGLGMKCGMDYGCNSEWVVNTRGLKLNTAEIPGVCKLGADIAIFPGETSPYDPAVEYCPVFRGWSEEKMARCIGIWSTRGLSGKGSVTLGAPLNLSAEYENTPEVPIKRTVADGSGLLFNVGIVGNQGYVDAIEATRKFCDEDDSDGMRCWLQGVAYDFWEQYIDLHETAGLVAACAGGAGFVISFLFLVFSFFWDSTLKAGICGKICAALFGAFVIVLICTMSIITVFGISTLAGSAFTVLLLTSVLTAIGFSVEFAVHIVHRFLTAPQDRESPIERVNYAMELLSLPMGCGCAASLVGLLCMLSSESNLVREVFFLPLILVQVVTFFFGTLFLPVVLTCVPCSCLRIGPDAGRGPDANADGQSADKEIDASI
mmetsp:Transcript_77815/g.220541  ORF Transcript_77815/g.220541 Transcript_77815/m.220541 type:complete len:1225 (+) Transcript_77815:141-3815(+)